MNLRKIRPLWIILALCALIAVAWAASELSGQANKSAADAGASSADMEFASLQMIKSPPKAPGLDKNRENQLTKQLAAMEKAYGPLVERAGAEAATGAVSEATRGQLTAEAAKYKETSYALADVYEKGKLISRAELARESGDCRVISADLIVSGANSEKSDALKTQQEKMNEARSVYVKEAVANKELSAADKAAVKATVMPQANKIVGDTGNLVKQITDLLNKIQSEATSGGASGCAGKAASGGSLENPTALLSPVKSLLSLAQGLATNAKSLASDATLLSQ